MARKLNVTPNTDGADSGGFSETYQTSPGGRLNLNPLPESARNFSGNMARTLGPDKWQAIFNQQAFGGSNLNLPGMQLANQDQARNEQARVIQALQAQARGDMNTLGQQQLAQGFQQAGAQQRSLGSSIRGTGGGAGLRAGMLGAADTQRGLVGQQEMLKLQEQQAAQAMLAQLLAQQQAQDVGLAGSMASGSLANQQLNQEMERFYGGLAQAGDIYAYQRAADLERAQAGYDLEARDAEARNAARLAQAGATAAGAISRFGGGNNGDRFRQVDGQNSIVPLEDK